MEKNTNQTTRKDTEKVVHNVEYVKLQDYGYEKAGHVKGDPEVYASYLSQIMNGDLVDENYKGLTEEEKSEKREKIKKLEKQAEEMQSENAKFDKEIAEKEKKIDQYRQQLLQIHEEHDKDHEKLHKDTFSGIKFGINLFILLALTVYLFFFYISAAYKALYTDLEKIASNIAEGLSTGSILPGPYELADAIRFNYLLFLVPFVFFAFGWAFHVIIEMKNQVKYGLLSLLVLLTFAVDALMAFIIHSNTEAAKEMMGLSTVSWSRSPTFYIILAFGFLAYVLWSILLHSMLTEWAKRQVTGNIKKIIKHLRNDIKRLQDKLLPVGSVKAEIDALREDMGIMLIGNLKKYIDQFTTGWISYAAAGNLKEIKTKCLKIKKDFEDKNNIRSGIVKVARRKD